MASRIWKMIKDYWQLIVGFLGSLILVLLAKNRDSPLSPPSSEEHGKKLIDIMEDDSKAREKAVDDFVKATDKAHEDKSERDSEIEQDEDNQRKENEGLTDEQLAEKLRKFL